MLSREQEHYILSVAYVPEHIPSLMSLISGGEPEMVDDCIAFRGGDWLILVGYPLTKEASHAYLEAVVERASAEYRPASLWIIAPSIPERFQSTGIAIERDRYYTISLDGYTPRARLLREVNKASESLRPAVADDMNSDHLNLTREFLERVALPDTIRELYLSMPRYVAGSDTAMVLEARTPGGALAAYYIVDTAPYGFLTYLVGCHSKKDYVPHASDFIFNEMLRLAGETGKREINLGLGVNEGITRFKTKWGGQPGRSYQSCEYRPPRIKKMHTAARILNRTESSARQPGTADRASGKGIGPLRWLKGERKFMMAWKLRYHGRESILAASAHFSPYSFRTSLEQLIKNARTVIFEGPLDQPDMEKVRTHGAGGGDVPSLCDALTPSTVRKINMTLGCPEQMQNPAFAAKATAMGLFDDDFLREETRGLRPWMALFRIWTRFLARQGWTGSVDLEAYDIARRMGKRVIFLETIEDQVGAMEGIPFENIVRFFELYDRWEGFARRYKKYYLKGDIEAIMGSTVVFPTRCESIVDRRDPVFFNGIKSFIEEGGACAFFGTIHIRGVLSLLREWGCEVRKC